MNKRRVFLKSIAFSTGAVFLEKEMYAKNIFNSRKQIACQQYTWSTYYGREGKQWMKDPKASLKAYKKSGLHGYEPFFNSPEEVSTLYREMEPLQIWAKSMYVNSTLHEPQLVEENIENIQEIAIEAKKIGIEIIVTNPTPIKWGGPENKTDEQLKTQALALNVLGKKLRSIGIMLAYHNHDAEMREGAREFHHMLTGTDAENVKLCLDAHWIYRGAGNSEVALFDIIELYADRIVELHLRQSQNGIWSEAFGPGDIDYGHVAKIIMKKGLSPHIVLEQAIEQGTPQTMGTIDAMSQSLQSVKKIFKDFL